MPIPKLVVLYNGKDECPDEIFLKLSDAFKENIRQNIIAREKNDDNIDRGELEYEVEKLYNEASPDIEVSVRMININYGHNPELLYSCKALGEYSWLVNQIRCNIELGMEIEKAVDEALDNMPDDYTIKDQLVAHRAEVVDMWITEYNEEEVMEMFRQEYLQEGMKKGKREGKIEGKREGETMLATLINKLLVLGKNDEIAKVTNNPDYREKLYVQYGIKKS